MEYNNNLYQSNLLRLLTQTDYNTLNGSISSVSSSLTTQINNAKPNYRKITRSYTSGYEGVIYTKPSNVNLVIAWATAQTDRSNRIVIYLGNDDYVPIYSKDYNSQGQSGIGMMTANILGAIRGSAGHNSYVSVRETTYNMIYVTVILDSGTQASTDISILEFT